MIYIYIYIFFSFYWCPYCTDIDRYMTPFLSPPKFEDRNFVKNPPEDGTVARATVVVERGPSELLNHMVPHVQGGLGAGEVDKPSMMIECDLVGVFFCQYFFCFPLPARWLARFFLWLLWLRWYCFYFVTVYISMSNLCIHKMSSNQSVGAGWIHFYTSFMANIQSKTATTCFFKAYLLQEGLANWEGSHIPSRLPGNKTTPPFSQLPAFF